MNRCRHEVIYSKDAYWVRYISRYSRGFGVAYRAPERIQSLVNRYPATP